MQYFTSVSSSRPHNLNQREKVARTASPRFVWGRWSIDARAKTLDFNHEDPRYTGRFFCLKELKIPRDYLNLIRWAEGHTFVSEQDRADLFRALSYLASPISVFREGAA